MRGNVELDPALTPTGFTIALFAFGVGAFVVLAALYLAPRVRRWVAVVLVSVVCTAAAAGGIAVAVAYGITESRVSEAVVEQLGAELLPNEDGVPWTGRRASPQSVVDADGRSRDCTLRYTESSTDRLVLRVECDGELLPRLDGRELN